MNFSVIAFSPLLANAFPCSKNDGWIINNFWLILLTSILAVIILDQVSYVSKKGPIAGSRFKLWPIIGPYMASKNSLFEDYKAQWNSGPLSCISVFHKFVVFGTTRDLARKALNSPAHLKPCLFNLATKIMRPTNWAFLDGKAHVDYRRSLNGLFSRDALKVYLPHQEDIYDKYLHEWVDISKRDGPGKHMVRFRDLNCAASLRAFCGLYITDDQVNLISANYYKIIDALDLVNFPIILPFTKAWYGKKTADMTMDILAQCAQKSKDNIGNGGTVECVMDSWVQLMLCPNSSTDNGEKQRHRVRTFTNKEISETFFTFLLAAQDAGSSAVTWAFQLLADRPEVMKKVKEEQLAVRGGDITKRMDLDMVNRMSYTYMVVKETLRYRPPVTMVPYYAKKDYPITENYTVPKGSLFIPTLYPALHDPEIYDDPEEFIPERWEEGSKASLAQKNWLVFGTGPHVCIGQNYVLMHLTALIGKACMLYDWKHTITPLSEKIKVFATIFPEDDCILEFFEREKPETVV